MSSGAPLFEASPRPETDGVRLVPQAAAGMQRPTARGKFLFAGDRKLQVCGVTYGTFRPDAEGLHLPPAERVREDFAAMARQGINAVRTYTPPPRWLLDLAQQHGLRVMVGLAWEQFIAFLDEPGRDRQIRSRVRETVRGLSGHPAVLCYSIGNEIPQSIVRWHGARRIERFLHRLYDEVKREDPTALVTYVNFPTTEYLRLPFLDLVCFNVYLEAREKLEAYLLRLHNLCDDRPLLMTEIGLDSRQHGDEPQAQSLSWQIQSAFESGCAGTFVFSWTDEWYRGGHEILDWDFGLTRRDRTPKPALAAVQRAYAQAPFLAAGPWPKISVVVCTYNGSATIRDTMEALQRLEYPDYEVIVIDDGSTDRTAAIVKSYPVRLIRTENRGLSSARNTGFRAASGEIVAYTDDDAYPDPHWLHYLARTFRQGYAGVGGPNLPPAGDGFVADCVANAPGGPVQVLLDDQLAEHVPGCNMAFRKSALEAIAGFDPVYRAAGDDVDLCWRLQEGGSRIGFAPAAVVWHHRRNSVRTYWKQQRGYGKAEALLERKWPQRYNAAGHVGWRGQLYGRGFTLSLGALGGRIYRGVFGTAPFQFLYQRRPGTWLELPLMPEWLFLLGVLGLAALCTAFWKPMGIAVPFFLLGMVLPVAQALASARRARFTSSPQSKSLRARLFALTTVLHLLQPVARLAGRLEHGLAPWRVRGTRRRLWRSRRLISCWREAWKAPEARLEAMLAALVQAGSVTTRGSDYDDWDLEVRGGLLGSARLRLGVEEHGAGKQMLRFRAWMRLSRAVPVLAAAGAGASFWAFMDGAVAIGVSLGLGAVGFCGAGAGEAARAMAALDEACPAATAD